MNQPISGIGIAPVLSAMQTLLASNVLPITIRVQESWCAELSTLRAFTALPSPVYGEIAGIRIITDDSNQLVSLHSITPEWWTNQFKPIPTPISTAFSFSDGFDASVWMTELAALDLERQPSLYVKAVDIASFLVYALNASTFIAGDLLNMPLPQYPPRSINQLVGVLDNINVYSDYLMPIMGRTLAATKIGYMS